MDHAVVAAERDGEAWWIVTRDVSSELLDEATPLTREQNRFVLSAAAAMWEEFWDDAPAVAASQRDRLSISSLAVAERERDALDLLPKQFDAAWAPSQRPSTPTSRTRCSTCSAIPSVSRTRSSNAA